MYTKALLLAFILTWTAAAPQDEGEVDYHVTLDDEYKAEHQTVEELEVLLRCLMDAGPCSEVYASYRKAVCGPATLKRHSVPYGFYITTYITLLAYRFPPDVDLHSRACFRLKDLSFCQDVCKYE